MSERQIPEEASDDFEAWVDFDHGPFMRPEDFAIIPTFEDGVRGFVQYVATQCAFNGADDKGQLFYDECLNPWLSEKAEQYLRDEVRGAE